MRTQCSRRSGVVLVVLCSMLSVGLLAVFAAPASADPLADKARAVDTDDGWRLTVTKTAENLDRYPNLAATMFTREGFVAIKGVAEISGAGTVPVQQGTVSLGYQIGCQVDVSTGLTVGMGLSVGPNASVTISQFPGATVGGSAAVTPNVSTTLKPGSITTVGFGTKPLAGPRASITADQIEVKVDACMGPVTLRSYVTARISTPTADNTVTVYGDPIWL